MSFESLDRPLRRARARATLSLGALSLVAGAVHCGSDPTNDLDANDASVDAPAHDATMSDSERDAWVDLDADASDAAANADAERAVSDAGRADADPDARDAATDGDAADAGDVPCTWPRWQCDGSCVDLATDPKNCGSCGSSCADDESCGIEPVDGGGIQCSCATCSPVEVVADHVAQHDTNGNIAIRDNTLYYSDTLLVWEQPLPSGSATPIFDPRKIDANASALTGVGVLAVDPSYVYAAPQAGAIVKIARDASHAVTVLATPGFVIYGMAVDSDYVYYSDSFHDTIWRVPTSGGSATILFAHENSPGGMAVVGDRLVWAAYGGVRWGLKSGGQAHDVAPTRGRTAITTNSDSAFFGDLDSVRKFDPTSGVVTHLASVTDWAAGMFADATHVYWTESRGTVRTVGVDGSGARTVADVPDNLRSIVADDTYVYWYAGFGARILKARH